MPWYKLKASHGPGHQSSAEHYVFEESELKNDEMDYLLEDWSYREDFQWPIGEVRKVECPPLKVLKELVLHYTYEKNKSVDMLELLEPLLESRKDGILSTDPKKLLQYAIDLNREYDWTGLSAQLFKTAESYGPNGRHVKRPANEKTFIEVVEEHVQSKLKDPNDIDPSDEDCIQSLYYMLLGYWSVAFSLLDIHVGFDHEDLISEKFKSGVKRHNCTRDEFFSHLDDLENAIPHFPSEAQRG